MRIFACSILCLIISLVRILGPAPAKAQNRYETDAQMAAATGLTGLALSREFLQQYLKNGFDHHDRYPADLVHSRDKPSKNPCCFDGLGGYTPDDQPGVMVREVMIESLTSMGKIDVGRVAFDIEAVVIEGMDHLRVLPWRLTPWRTDYRIGRAKGLPVLIDPPAMRTRADLAAEYIRSHQKRWREYRTAPPDPLDGPTGKNLGLLQRYDNEERLMYALLQITDPSSIAKRPFGRGMETGEPVPPMPLAMARVLAPAPEGVTTCGAKPGWIENGEILVLGQGPCAAAYDQPRLSLVAISFWPNTLEGRDRQRLAARRCDLHTAHPAPARAVTLGGKSFFACAKPMIETTFFDEAPEGMEAIPYFHFRPVRADLDGPWVEIALYLTAPKKDQAKYRAILDHVAATLVVI